MPKTRSRWETLSLATYGGLLGIAFAMMEQFCHAFCPASWSYTPEGDMLVHVLVEVITFAAGGAALPAGIAVIRNWLSHET
jgi:hypothetical protein